MHCSVCSTKQQKQLTISMFFQMQQFLKRFATHSMMWMGEKARKAEQEGLADAKVR